MKSLRSPGVGRPRRPLLAVVGCSIAVNAALGIYALVVPHFGSLQGRVLATSACVTGAGVLVLACLPARERGRLSVWPALGIVAAPAGFALIVIGLWAEIDRAAYGKALGTVLIVAAVSTVACVLSLAELARRYRRMFPVAVTLAVVLGTATVAGIWVGFPGGWYPRAVGVVAVLFAAAVVSVPILHRASRGEPRTAAATTTDTEGAAAPDAPALRFCPACGNQVVPAAGGAGGGAACGRCGARCEVRFLREG